jgi:hypothetical protein
VCRFHVAAVTKLRPRRGAIYKLSGAVAKLASINLRKLVLSPTRSINLGFILREDLLLCSSYLPLGVPNWAVIYTPSESMSGMKINYHKSEVFVMGCDVEEQQRVANLFNYKLGVLPMVYLGVPIGEYRLNNENFMPLSGKMTKRMDPWKCKLMSSATRLTLSNACLANLPTFMMGFYYLGEGVHVEMDKVRGRFYWEGDAQTFKYHMMKWENVCKPKEYGGLGIIYTRFMNIALLLKWIWKFF